MLSFPTVRLFVFFYRKHYVFENKIDIEPKFGIHKCTHTKTGLCFAYFQNDGYLKFVYKVNCLKNIRH